MTLKANETGASCPFRAPLHTCGSPGVASHKGQTACNGGQNIGLYFDLKSSQKRSLIRAPQLQSLSSPHTCLFCREKEEEVALPPPPPLVTSRQANPSLAEWVIWASCDAQHREKACCWGGEWGHRTTQRERERQKEIERDGGREEQGGRQDNWCDHFPQAFSFSFNGPCLLWAGERER